MKKILLLLLFSTSVSAENLSLESCLARFQKVTVIFANETVCRDKDDISHILYDQTVFLCKEHLNPNEITPDLLVQMRDVILEKKHEVFLKKGQKQYCAEVEPVLKKLQARIDAAK